MALHAVSRTSNVTALRTSSDPWHFVRSLRPHRNQTQVEAQRKTYCVTVVQVACCRQGDLLCTLSVVAHALLHPTCNRLLHFQHKSMRCTKKVNDIFHVKVFMTEHHVHHSFSRKKTYQMIKMFPDMYKFLLGRVRAALTV